MKNDKINHIKLYIIKWSWNFWIKLSVFQELITRQLVYVNSLKCLIAHDSLNDSFYIVPYLWLRIITSLVETLKWKKKSNWLSFAMAVFLESATIILQYGHVYLLMLLFGCIFRVSYNNIAVRSCLSIDAVICLFCLLLQSNFTSA